VTADAASPVITNERSDQRRHGRSLFDLRPGLFTWRLRKWPKYFALVVAAVEFAPTWKNAYYVESRGFQMMVANNLFALNPDARPLSSHFTRWKPNRIVVVTAIKPQLIQGYNAMPGSLFLDLDHL
jgi:hypothetical protein